MLTQKNTTMLYKTLDKKVAPALPVIVCCNRPNGLAELNIVMQGPEAPDQLGHGGKANFRSFQRECGPSRNIISDLFMRLGF